MKKLRAGVQIHAQAPVHSPEVLGKLEAGIAVMRPDAEPYIYRYDVYYVK